MPVISEGSACGCLVHRCCPAVSWSMEEELWQRRQLTCSGGLWKFSCGDHFSERQWLSPGRGGGGVPEKEAVCCRGCGGEQVIVGPEAVG